MSQVLYQIWEAEQTDGNQRQQRQQQQQQQQQPSKWQQDVKNQAGEKLDEAKIRAKGKV